MNKTEIEELKLSIYERLCRAIESGNKEQALSLAGEYERNRQRYRDIFLGWIDGLLIYVGDKLGEDAVYETLRIFDSWGPRPIANWILEPEKPEERLRKRAYNWNTLHCAHIDEIVEDEEKYTFRFRCPSGGTVRRWESYGKTKEGHPWSYGEKDFSYYCAHCTVSFGLMSVERTGYPAWVNLPQPGGMCVLHLYKNPTSVPGDYYKKIGMEKNRGGNAK